MTATPRPVGELLREWRQRRRLSQLELALDAALSTRHLSFLETGRSQPSREMLLRLAERLGVPLRERNALLVAAGFAPVYPQRPLDDPALAAARRAVDVVLAGHEPFPAVAVDRHWTIVAANPSIRRLLANVGPAAARPPVNVLRLSLHPDGLAPRIVNLPEVRRHILARLRQQIDSSADPVLAALLAELAGYPAQADDHREPDPTDVIVPIRLASPAGVLNLFSTTTVFGTPIDVTLAELAVEAFYPADAATADALRAAADPAENSVAELPVR